MSEYPWQRFSTGVVLAIVFGLPALITDVFAMGWFASIVLFMVLVAIVGFPMLILSIFAHSYSSCPSNTSMGITKYARFTEEKLNEKYAVCKIPISILQDHFINDRLDMEPGHLLELLSYSQYFTRPVLTFADMTFLIRRILPSCLKHFNMQKNQDFYDRGPEFFKLFLGPSMVDSCAYFAALTDELKSAQKQKLELICQKLQMQVDDSFLDIGCGWGSLIMHATRRFGLVNATALTTNKTQKEFVERWVSKHGHTDRTRVIQGDFTKGQLKLPFKKYDKIACVEMAEEGSLRGFKKTLANAYNLLEENGTFLLQMKTGRRCFEYADFHWMLAACRDEHVPDVLGLFSVGYIVQELESAGFEVQSSTSLGMHYFFTYKSWHDNWLSHEELITSRYGEEIFRKWLWFFAWSVVSAGQGSINCHQFICFKSNGNCDRTKYMNSTYASQNNTLIN